MEESTPTQTADTVDKQSFKFPLFTGHFNGFGVELKSPNEISLLYQWNFFGKGSFSRSKPSILKNKDNCEILRKRQFQKREEWFKKFNENVKPSNKEINFEKDIGSLVNEIKESSEGSKDFIDLVSSDEEVDYIDSTMENINNSIPHLSEENLVMVVPNSDSEGEDYFNNLKPKCCYNKVKVSESLILTLQEAYFLSYAFGCLQIIDLDENPLSLEQAWKLFTETEEDFVPKYIVFHYFRSKGYIVKPGIKFGGDYLLYREGPGHGHADYIVIIKYKSSNWLPMLGHIRMAGTTSKEILVAEVIPQIDCTLKCVEPADLSNYCVRETVWNKKMSYSEENNDQV